MSRSINPLLYTSSCCGQGQRFFVLTTVIRRQVCKESFFGEIKECHDDKDSNTFGLKHPHFSRTLQNVPYVLSNSVITVTSFPA
jgi:hypothetical protein